MHRRDGAPVLFQPRSSCNPMLFQMFAASQLVVRSFYLLLVFLFPMLSAGLAFLSSWFREKVCTHARAAGDGGGVIRTRPAGAVKTQAAIGTKTITWA